MLPCILHDTLPANKCAESKALRIRQIPGHDAGCPAFAGGGDEKVEAAVVGARQGDDVEQAHRAEAWQQAKNQDGAAQDQRPLPA